MFELTRLLVFVAACCLVRSNDDTPSVRTPLGSISGYYKISEYGRAFQAYEGIPYAQPPIGELRFRAPEPVKPWPGNLQATKTSDVCLQYNHEPDIPGVDRVKGSEDCLYLNIYVPDRNENTPLLPVILYIHGGAFTFGSGSAYGGRFLMDRDVILVTINYRLGPLGFLSTEDNVVSGNMGLKDQSMALRWVNENIESFGGNPEKITLIGLSAGGASVHYHYLTPLSANLFQNGISFSGTALDCWTQAENSLEKAKKLGALMGCPTECTKEMVTCLRSRPARPIVQAVRQFMPWLFNPYTPFGPVVEKSEDKPFINRSPVEILDSGEVLDVPWITSVTSEEGLYPVAEFIANDKFLKELDENWVSLAPHLLDFNFTISQNMQKEVSLKIRKHYLGDNPINRETANKITKMVGDRLFVVDAEKAARMQAKVNKSPVWFYYYSYRSTKSLSDAFSGTKENFGVSHGDDVFLLFDNDYVNPAATENDRTMQNNLLDLCASYAENGISGIPNWSKIDPSQKDFKYLQISGPGEFKMTSSNNLGQKQFWSSINFHENILDSDESKIEL